VSTVALAALAGTAHGQAFTFNGGSAANGSWTDNTNWAGGAAPAAGGAANLVITINVPANAQTAMRQDRGNPFVLNQLIYHVNSKDTVLGTAGNAAQNRPIQFRENGQTAPRLTLNGTGPWQTINTPIQLNSALGMAPHFTTIDGAAVAGGGGAIAPRLILNGAITMAAGANPQGLTIIPSDITRVEMNGASTYTAGTVLNSGILMVGNNAAVGSGTFTLQAAANRKVRVVAAPAGGVVQGGFNTFTLANELRLLTDSTFGEELNMGDKARLRFNGNVVINQGANVNTRLEGGAAHELVLAGAISHDKQRKWTVVGDQPPVRNANDTRVLKAGVGSKIVISGNSNDYQGETEILSSIFQVDGVLGQNTPMGNRVRGITVGDGTTLAALTGKGTVIMLKASQVSAAEKLRFVKLAVLKPGGSPGVLTVNGGEVSMEGGSVFGIDYAGTEAGQSDFDNAQLLLEDSTMVLTADAGTGQRPILDVRANNGFVPLVGSELTIVRQNAVEDAPFAAIGMSSGNIFEDVHGVSLSNGAIFTQLGITYQIIYNHTPGSWSNPLDGQSYFSFGDETLNDGNDVVLRVLAVPAPGAVAMVGLAVLGAGRRRRR
jgi:autotransporter-associated beta strand protein